MDLEGEAGKDILGVKNSTHTKAEWPQSVTGQGMLGEWLIAHCVGRIRGTEVAFVKAGEVGLHWAVTAFPWSPEFFRSILKTNLLQHTFK